MKGLLKKLVRNVKAQDLAEYGIALAVIGAGAAAAAVVIAGTRIRCGVQRTQLSRPQRRKRKSKPKTEPASALRRRKKEDTMTFLKKLLSEKKAQDLAEYGIALAVIGAGAAAAAVVIAGNVNSLWSAANSIIATAAILSLSYEPKFNFQ